MDAWIQDAARRAGATVLDGRKAESVERAPAGILVRGRSVAGPWQLRARLLLGADGSNSMVARTLRGGVPPSQDRIMAVRAYFDDVEGADGQGDIWIRGDTFPGYHWLFPTGGGSANLGVGMLASTYPRSGRNLREMLLRLIDEDAPLRHRLRGARMRGRVLGHPLTTYNPRLPLIGDRLMLLGDAAGLINPLNGEGIQYALHSARWAAGIAADRLASDQLDAGSLVGYQRRVHQSLRHGPGAVPAHRPAHPQPQPEPRLAGRPAIHRVPGQDRSGLRPPPRLRSHRPDPGRQHGRHRRGRADLRASARVPAGRRVLAPPQRPGAACASGSGRSRRQPAGTPWLPASS